MSKYFDMRLDNWRDGRRSETGVGYAPKKGRDGTTSGCFHRSTRYSLINGHYMSTFFEFFRSEFSKFNDFFVHTNPNYRRIRHARRASRSNYMGTTRNPSKASEYQKDPHFAVSFSNLSIFV